MDCQRGQPFQYLIHEQAKSLLALQELQHEVGALLEFREVVMDTFPNLRHKLEPAQSPQWEPGVKVKRKIVPKTTDGISGVQDSGFSTETNSSNKNEAEEELWNLLDVIETKGVKLREDVEALQQEIWERDRPKVPPRRCRSLDSLPDPAPFPLDLQDLELLLDKLTRLETESNASRVRTCELQEEMAALLATKEELEEQLQVVLGQKSELNRCVQQLLKGESQSSHDIGQKPLGALDHVLTDPHRLKTFGKVGKLNRKKIEAILKENNTLELRRHLIISVAENQILNRSLDSVRSEKEGLVMQLDKCKDENDQLKFRLEERNIELEGTKAQVRMLERMHKPRSDENFLFLEGDNLRSKGFSENEISRAREIFESPNQQVLPILALPLREISTEAESMDSTKKSPRRRPSRIPLSSPSLYKSTGDVSKEAPKSTTTVMVTYKKSSPSASIPSLKPTYPRRESLPRRAGQLSHSSEANRSLRSHSESGRSLRSRDSLSSTRREPTPTRTTPGISPSTPPSTAASKTPDTVKATSDTIRKVPKTPIPRRRTSKQNAAGATSCHASHSPVPSVRGAYAGGAGTGIAPRAMQEDAETPGSSNGDEKPGVIKEVRRSFHRRLADKLALNLSGVRQLLYKETPPTPVNVWNSGKSGRDNDRLVSSSVLCLTSIDDELGEKESASIIQSCSFLDPLHCTQQTKSSTA